jgi:NADH-quinone oxidoreductase subunit N
MSAAMIVYLPALLAALGAIAALAFDVFDRRMAAAASAVAGVGAAAVVVAVQSWSFLTPVLSSSSPPPDGGRTLSVAVAVSATIVLAGAWRRVVSSERGGTLAGLGALCVSGALVMLGATDLVTLVIALEATALCAYALVAIADTARAREAAMKYFVQGAVATTFLVVALGILLAVGAGSAGYSAVAEGSVPGSFPMATAMLGWALLAAALAFKAGAFPFHSWAPDAYETADAPAAALLASVVKSSVIGAAAIVLLTAGETSGIPAVPSALPAAIAVGSIVFGNLAALRQTSFKRMLAYSGIAQAGYAFVGIAAQTRATVGLFMACYAIAAAGAFMVVEAIAETDSAWDGTIGGLAGLARRRPGLAAALTVLMLSLTGMPLAAGFVGKLAVFSAAVVTGTAWLALIGVIGSVVSFGYYGAVIRAAYLSENGEPEPGAAGRPGPATIAVAVAAALTVVIGLTPLITGMGALVQPFGW